MEPRNPAACEPAVSEREVDPGVRFRAYRRDDLDGVYALDLICFEPPFRFSRGMMRRCAEARNALTVVATRDAAIVGFCIAHVERARRQSVAYIVTLDVAPEERRRGLAGLMMRQIQEQARAAACIAIALHVSVENEGAMRFYEREGYSRSHLVESFYGRGRHAFVYSKALTNEDLPAPAST